MLWCYIFFRRASRHSFLFAMNMVLFSAFDSKKNYIAKSKNHFYINQLPLTLTVIQEPLHLFPPLSNPRAGEPGFDFIDTNCYSLPTDDLLVMLISQAVHRDPQLWPSRLASRSNASSGQRELAAI